jgi:23S rRNA (cytosine1962-C5)-methyltransferase
MSTIQISNRGAKRIRHGHLWVYRSDVRRADAEAGEIVEVLDEASNFVGQAFYSDASEITLRFLTTSTEAIDREWWLRRLRRSFQTRPQPLSEEHNAQRIIYSEGDLLPSIIVDFYAGHIVLQTLSQGAD